MKSRSDYEAEVSRLAEGDSNDEEIDTLQEMVGQLLDDRDRLLGLAAELSPELAPEVSPEAAGGNTPENLDAQIAWLEQVAARRRDQRPELDPVDSPSL
jgi:hypothetical protein